MEATSIIWGAPPTGWEGQFLTIQGLYQNTPGNLLPLGRPGQQSKCIIMSLQIILGERYKRRGLALYLCLLICQAQGLRSHRFRMLCCPKSFNGQLIYCCPCLQLMDLSFPFRDLRLFLGASFHCSCLASTFRYFCLSICLSLLHFPHRWHLIELFVLQPKLIGSSDINNC